MTPRIGFNLYRVNIILRKLNYVAYRCVEELKTNDKWALPALKVLRDICCLYEVGGGTGLRPLVTRQELIDRLQTQHSLVILVTDSLTNYMGTVRCKLEGMYNTFLFSLRYKDNTTLCYIFQHT